jgi:pimeloyl-ACP methyl ester carboxylesterase
MPGNLRRVAIGVAIVALGAVAVAAAISISRHHPRGSHPGADSPATRAAWHDPSPHAIRRVRTAPGVELEVLDWGGTGLPLVFLAGYGNTAHVFDGFAPRFTDAHRVIGITRRGFGASCCPADGYDSRTLAADIVAVLDALGLARASFAAHSFGGSELNRLAVDAPGRIDRLVYLDAGVDFAQLYADAAWLDGPFPRPSFPADARNTPAEVARWMARFAGPGYPESEVRATSRLDANGELGEPLVADSVQQRLMRGTTRAELRRIHAPVLAIYAVPRTPAEKYPWIGELDREERALVERRFALESRILGRQRERFRREVRGVTVVEVPGARHYVFLTHPDLVAARMREFLRP